MKYKQLRESCFFKTGRSGVVVEWLDSLEPNIFNDNKNVGKHVFKKYSCFKTTIIDSRKKEKGNAVYYNLSPGEILLLAHMISDGDEKKFFERAGAYAKLNQLDQVKSRNIVETFDQINFARFDALIKNAKDSKGTSVTFQKNFNVKGDDLLVRKITLSYEEAINSSSKWKLTIEKGHAQKDEKGNGLNIVKNGTYQSEDKAHVLLQYEEVVIPINEASKRIIVSYPVFYAQMQRAEVKFTERKQNEEDWNGERINDWNPEGKPKVIENKKREQVKKPETVSVQKQVDQPEEKPKENSVVGSIESVESAEPTCEDCSEVVNDKVKAFSQKRYNKILCYNCQKKH